MSVIPDYLIRTSAVIDPYRVVEKKPGVISSGESCCGYDLTLRPKLRIFQKSAIPVDPKHVNPRTYTDKTGDRFVLEPGAFALGESLERIEIPRDVVGLVLCKSTYARIGVITNFTPLESGWRGTVTIEITNSNPNPVVVYANEGICQVLFLRLEAPCLRDYSDRQGRYQDQEGIQLPEV